MDETIIFCMEQKEVLLKNLLNLTKRMEVRCRQEEVDLEDFTEQRQICFDRIKKCDALIQKKLQEIENKEQQEHLLTILKAACTLEECTSVQESDLLQTVQRCEVLLKEGARLNSSVIKILRVKCNDMREKINEVRAKQVKQQEIFH